MGEARRKLLWEKHYKDCPRYHDGAFGGDEGCRMSNNYDPLTGACPDTMPCDQWDCPFVYWVDVLLSSLGGENS